jgi:hypothetical protein
MLTEIMNGHDVGVVECRDRLCFLLEAMQPVRIARELGGQHFDSNVAVEPRVPRTVDFAHPPCASRRDHFVWSKFGTGVESHVRAIIVD